MAGSGCLYVVATPIGNLEDITLRALRVLKECDLILAEDTRRTRVLLSHHHIEAPSGGLVSCHEHNEAARVGLLLDRLSQGQGVALVTDAGTPAISDPGYRLVAAAHDANHAVVPVPGACAAVAALSAGGLPTDRFSFVGFPPKKAGARRRWLDELATAQGTLVMYVAGRDVPAVLDDLVATRGDVEVSVFRELTKRFEESLRGRASHVADDWRANPRKGEVTLLCGRPAKRDFDDATLLELLRGDTVKDVAADTGVSRRRLYQLALTLKGLDGS